jgi:hypothetical protein
LTASVRDKQKVVGTEIHAKMIANEDAVKSAAKALRAKIAQETCITGNC